MTNEMRLQGIGMVEGTMAGLVQVGDVLRWNYGGLERVTAIEFTKTAKTIICQTEYINSKGELVQSERKMRVTRLVNIVGSGNTVLTGDYTFEIIPPVEEIKAVDMELIFDDAEEIAAVEEPAVKSFHNWLVERLEMTENFTTSDEIEKEAYKICVQYMAEGNEAEGIGYWDNLCDEYSDYKRQAARKTGAIKAAVSKVTATVKAAKQVNETFFRAIYSQMNDKVTIAYGSKKVMAIDNVSRNYNIEGKNGMQIAEIVFKANKEDSISVVHDFIL